MAIKNDEDTRLVFRCPFCYRGEGDIRIDLTALRQWQQPASVESRQIDIAEVPEQRVIRFCRGDAVTTRPCPHMVALYADIYEKTDMEIIRATECSFEWDNPWFDVPGESQDARHEVEVRVFTEDLKAHPDFPKPKTPYRDRWISKVLETENGRELIASGRAIVALEPERMLDDLLAALRTSSLPTS